ncbi:hypothetical protein SLA2020_177810 [Shorea laevis]
MGSCFSARIKAECPPHHENAEPVSKNSSRYANDLSCSSRQFSSLSVLMPQRTEGEILQSSNLKSFSFNELKTATRNFRPDSVLVKRLNKEGSQGHQEWLAEINYLGQLYHPNLVKLIGYCLDDVHRLLVYEFMPRGSLENHLFRRNAQPLSWNDRMKIALGAAKGLAFLHSDEAKVIYRDFKTSNVLLDSNYSAKLSDFGLAKDGPTGDKTHVSTRVMGTYGYAAPEYVATGHLTARSDIYSFGVVLLEMLSGRQVLDKNRPSREQDLVEWAKPYLNSKRRVFQVMDARIENQYPLDAARKAASLALQCLSAEPKHRPSMNAVVKALEQLQEPDVNEAGSQIATSQISDHTSRNDPQGKTVG